MSKNMNKEEYHKYLESPRWKMISDYCKKLAGNRCRGCNVGSGLQAHHRTYAHVGDELNHMDDLTCLCTFCHAAITVVWNERWGKVPAPKAPKVKAPAMPRGEHRKVWKQQRKQKRQEDKRKQQGAAVLSMLSDQLRKDQDKK